MLPTRNWPYPLHWWTECVWPIKTMKRKSPDGGTNGSIERMIYSKTWGGGFWVDLILFTLQAYLRFSFLNEKCDETCDQKWHAKVDENCKQKRRKIVVYVVSLEYKIFRKQNNEQLIHITRPLYKKAVVQLKLMKKIANMNRVFWSKQRFSCTKCSLEYYTTDPRKVTGLKSNEVPFIPYRLLKFAW